MGSDVTRPAMWLLLGTVAIAAAVLSFSALSDLADLCGFHRSLSALLPVVVDAGAAAGALIWLGTSSPVRALRFARALTWLLLASSVGGNAVVHYLAAYSLRPAWWLVVLVSAVAPIVLGSVIHLAVLVGRGDVSMSESKRQSEISVRKSGPNFQSETPPSPPVPKRAKVAPSTDKKSTKTAEAEHAEAQERRRAKNREYQRRAYERKRLEREAMLSAEPEVAEAPRNGHAVLQEAK
jgi:hypothetical protein